MSKQNSSLTPLMQQYFEIKEKLPDTLLLFQVGDFYEMFFDDAKKAAAFLGIALTKRGKIDGKPIPLCGVPLHAMDFYITKLVKGGFKVAICDQLEEATPGKVVHRGVTQILTPGTLTDSKLLDEKSASYLFSFFPAGDHLGLLFGELLTAQLFATVLPQKSSEKSIESELIRFFPDEILLPDSKDGKQYQSFFKRLGYFTTLSHMDLTDTTFTSSVNQWINRQFRAKIANQVQQYDALFYTICNFYTYVERNQASALEHFKTLHFYNPEDFLMLDPSTQKNLELIRNNHDGSRKHAVISLIDKAVTAMGSRMIKKWLVRPLIKRELIEQRHDVVHLFVENIALNQKLHEQLSPIGDLERVVGRIALNRAMLNDYLALVAALHVMPKLRDQLLPFQHVTLIQVVLSYLGDFSELYTFLKAALNDDRAKEWIIKKGFDQKLDYLRELVQDSNKKILALEQKEQLATGISSLKIRYNKVHGYYIEVTKTNLKLVPERYMRQQTLVGRERYSTGELRDLQHEIVTARTHIETAEKEVFDNVKREVLQYMSGLRKLSHAVAHLDALLSLGTVAYDNGYVRPVFHDNRDIIIKEGRHPVVEVVGNARFIPNDVTLTDEQSLWIITGPNMGGKSTFLRQVALICILAQCGSFVPAKSAELALLDRIFTRIGSGDNLAAGKSTFLVEMEETAQICNMATRKSLVILDEVGRGTSTFDGVAIAQAVVEYTYQKVQARCLFATHYHELTGLKDRFEGIKSYYAASKRTKGGILFLYKIIQGVADGSFGIEVAKLAQLPETLIARADDILHNLTVSQSVQCLPLANSENQQFLDQIQMLQAELKQYKNRLSALESVDYNELSPRRAFDLLWELKGD